MAAKTKEDKPLRHGYTTGACATAATKAALLALITGEVQHEVTIRLPIGEEVTFPLARCEVGAATASAAVIKDGGDDPDATHGALIVSTVSWSEAAGIQLEGGEGVGRVTKPGLPVPVGEAAINPVPRAMIREAVQSVLRRFQLERGVRVVISVPDGEEIAKKTLNGRLGIIGGISILGTRGIVVPYSTAAYKASIAQAINVAREAGCRHIVLSTGGKSEKTAMALYPELPEVAFVEMGDFAGFSLKQCKQKQVERVTLVGMMGKFSKLAQGEMMLHSKRAPVDFAFLARVAAEAEVPQALRAEIGGANTAAQVAEMLAAYPLFFHKLCEYCCRSCLKEVQGGMTIETILITMTGSLLGRVTVDGTGD
jgi:cobalt-precorrin-5B (C1)-methyltransferase